MGEADTGISTGEAAAPPVLAAFLTATHALSHLRASLMKQVMILLFTFHSRVPSPMVPPGKACGQRQVVGE